MDELLTSRWALCGGVRREVAHLGLGADPVRTPAGTAVTGAGPGEVRQGGAAGIADGVDVRTFSSVSQDQDADEFGRKQCSTPGLYPRWAHVHASPATSDRGTNVDRQSLLYDLAHWN